MMGSIPLRHQLFLPRGVSRREENARRDDDDGHAVGFAPLVEWFEARVEVNICPLSATSRWKNRSRLTLLEKLFAFFVWRVNRVEHFCKGIAIRPASIEDTVVERFTFNISSTSILRCRDADRLSGPMPRLSVMKSFESLSVIVASFRQSAPLPSREEERAYPVGQDDKLGVGVERRVREDRHVDCTVADERINRAVGRADHHLFLSGGKRWGRPGSPPEIGPTLCLP